MIMENRLENFLNLVTFSRRFNLLTWFFIFPVSTILGAVLKIKLVSLIGPFLICVGLMLPGMFILFRVPWFAQAWLRGINTFFQETPWEQLPSGQKFSVYFYSITCLIASIAGIVMYSVPLFR